MHHSGGSPESGKAYFCLRMESPGCGYVLQQLNGHFLQSGANAMPVRIKTSHLILTWLD